MQEEQRSLSTLETLSVWRLVGDDTVRWQVLSVAVINVGMQLSSIDAVSWQRRSFTCRYGCCRSQAWKTMFGGRSLRGSLRFSEYIKKGREKFSRLAHTEWVLFCLIEVMSCC